MPAGEAWFEQRPSLGKLSTAKPFWHVYSARHGAIDANPKSTGRLALVGTHNMFYVADSLAAALWETVLRDVEPNTQGNVMIPAGSLRDMRAVKVKLLRRNVDLLHLGQPHLRRVFRADSEEARKVADMLRDPEYTNSHATARTICMSLQRVGVPDMPVLGWPSRQKNSATVYLFYAPPMNNAWWRIDGKPIELDAPSFGHQAIRRALQADGFSWTPAATTATRPGPN